MLIWRGTILRTPHVDTVQLKIFNSQNFYGKAPLPLHPFAVIFVQLIFVIICDLSLLTQEVYGLFHK